MIVMDNKSLAMAERFMRYVQIDTQSDPVSNHFPSTEKQFNLARLLVAELHSMGIQDAHVDANGYVMATIPANLQLTKEAVEYKNLPIICFCAHMDTTPDCSGTHVKPILHKNYSGDPIVLPDDPSQIITVEAYPYLKNFVGASIITASGKTLLGADDKAGVSIIMELAKQLMEDKTIQHGPVKILFTPDEEVGKGTDKLDLKKLGATYGYTLDGGALGSFELETFSADNLILHIEGVIAHPGAAKGIMQNAIKVAAEILAALPKKTGSPEHTSDREGFIHPHHIEGDAEKARIEFLIRDFDTPTLKVHANHLIQIAEKVVSNNPDFSNVKLSMECKEQYRNMREIIELHPTIVDKAIMAYQQAGITPIILPIRGGTDGSKMSFMGLPTPNIFTGMQAIHSKHEWIGVSDMLKAVEVLVHLVEIN